METTPAAREALSGERRRITALFADVVGSTRLAEDMDPEDWADLMNQAFAVMAEAIDRYEGTVSQFRGDEVVALFGAPTAHEDDPWRAVQAGLDMVAGVDQLARTEGTALQIRVGVNTGLAVVGEVGGGSHTEYTAMGDAMNLAARMQSAAPPGSLLITADTYRLVGSDFEVRDAGPIEVKGKAHPVHTYEVVGSRGVSTRGRGVPGLRSPMVGRDAQLETLESLLEAASVGRGRVAVVIGEPGIGKSRLVRELRARVADRDQAGWALGQCISYGLNLPYHLVISLVRALIGASDGDDPEEVVEALQTNASELLGPDSPALRHLAELVGPGEVPQVGDPARKRAYLKGVAALVEANVARRSPLVLVGEDIHWADPSSSEQLADLLPLCHDKPVLVVLTTRPDRTVPGWGVIEAARQQLGEALTEIELRPLPEGDSRRLVSHLLEIEALPEELRGKVLDKAEGNPFFVEEVVRMLIERGAIERRGERWVATGEIHDTDVPDTLEALIAARVDRLPAEARSTARTASVIGRRFPVHILEAMGSHQANGSIHPDLGVLEAHGLVRLAATRPQLEYAFRHALVHQVVYSSLLKRERRKLHREVGDLIERLHPDHDELTPVLAHHFEEADDPRAADYLLAAGRWALSRFAVREAYDFFQRAAGRLTGDDPDTMRARVEAAIGRDLAGITFVPGGEILSILEQALPDAEAVDDPRLLAQVHMGIVRTRQFLGDLYDSSDALRSSLDRAFRYAEEVGDPALRALPAAMMGEVRMAAGELEEAVKLWEETVPELERQGLLSDASIYAGLLARACAVMGRFDQAEHWIEESADLAHRSGDPNAILDADLYRGWVEQERGNLEEAHEFTRRAIRAADEIGNVACSLVGNLIAGDQQLRMGRPQAAIPFLERGGELVAYCEVGNDLLALGKAWLAAARSGAGTHGLRDFDEALEEARQAHIPLSEGDILRHRAAARLDGPEPDWEGAFADLEQAARLFEEIGARSYLARTLQDHGAALELAGRAEEATAYLERAAGLFEDMGISVPA